MTFSERSLEENKKALNDVMDRFTIEDFKRVHSKFFNSLIALEVGFSRRFPKECEEHLKELYGEK